MIKINLLPKKDNKFVVYSFYSGIIIFILTLSIYGYLSWINSRFNLTLDIYSLEDKTLDSTFREIKDLKRKISKTKKNVSQFRERKSILNAKGDATISVMERLPYIIPINIYLTKIHSDSYRKLTVEGESINYKHLSKWLEDLGNLNDLTGVNLLELKGQKRIKFKIEIEVGGGLECPSSIIS